MSGLKNNMTASPLSTIAVLHRGKSRSFRVNRASPNVTSPSRTRRVLRPRVWRLPGPKPRGGVTGRANLVGVVTNGSAVLGLGNIGALASKPVMEGKAVLFKRFAGIDVFDIEVDCSDPDKFIEIVESLGPTFGGINLEDIKAPECFYIERELRKRMNIPVFHDDQHGTAIIAGAALLTHSTPRQDNRRG